MSLRWQLFMMISTALSNTMFERYIIWLLHPFALPVACERIPRHAPEGIFALVS